MSRVGFPKEVFETHQTHGTYVRASDGAVFHDFGTSHYLTRYEDKVGENTPGWPNRKATNNYLRSAFFLGLKDPVLHAVKTTNSATGNIGDQSLGTYPASAVYGGYNPWSAGSVFSTDFARNRVRERLVAKLIGQVQENRVQLGEILHTRHQTSAMVGNTLHRIAGSVFALKRGNIRGAMNQLFGAKAASRLPIKKAIGGIPEQWLALKYGWLPLLQDIHSSQELLKRRWTDGAELLSISASARESLPKVEQLVDGFPWYPGARFHRERGSVRGKAQIHYRISNDARFDLSQFGVTNPLSLTWELLPWSFVLDWALPIGPFLESLTYSQGLTFVRGWISLKSEDTCTVSLRTPTLSYDGWNRHWSGGGGRGSAMVFTREALSAWPALSAPRFKDPFSPTHVANGLSLLATAFGRKR